MPMKFLSILCALILSIMPLSAQTLKNQFREDQESALYQIFRAYFITKPLSEITKGLGLSRLKPFEYKVTRLKIRANSEKIDIDKLWLKANIDADSSIDSIVYHGYHSLEFTDDELEKFYTDCIQHVQVLDTAYNRYFDMYTAEKSRPIGNNSVKM